jgi:hypothetical protein
VALAMDCNVNCRLVEKQMCSEFRETEEHHEHVENLQEHLVQEESGISNDCFNCLFLSLI